MGLGEMPIQIDSIACLLSVRQGRLCDGRALRAGDNRRWANFSATDVRFYFTLTRAPLVGPRRGLPSCRQFTPVSLLACPTAGNPVAFMSTVDAVNMATIAVAEQIEHCPAAIHTTLNLPQIVHSRGM